MAALKAIAKVESGGAGFDAQGRPKILYERQVFARCCTPKGRFNAEHPDISAPTGYGRGNYGSPDSQWTKLARAFQLDHDAALKACSWGTFQILCENHKISGFPDVRSFVAEKFASPAGHLRALVRFIRANPSIHQGLKTHAGTTSRGATTDQATSSSATTRRWPRPTRSSPPRAETRRRRSRGGYRVGLVMLLWVHAEAGLTGAVVAVPFAGAVAAGIVVTEMVKCVNGRYCLSESKTRACLLGLQSPSRSGTAQVLRLRGLRTVLAQLLG